MASIVTVHAQPLKEGYGLLFDVQQGQWCRVFMALTHKELRLSSSSSTTHRIAARQPLVLADIEALFCSVADANAPARHVPLLGVKTARGELVLLRTAERKSLADWMATLEKALPDCPVHPVQAMAACRQSFSPSLYAQLFKSDEERIPRFGGGDGTAATACIPGAGGRRIASLSAGCPRRAPIRRAFGTILQVMHGHADPAANPPLSAASSRLPTPSASCNPSRGGSPVNAMPAAAAAPTATAAAAGGRKSASPPSGGGATSRTAAAVAVASKLLRATRGAPLQTLQRIEQSRSKSRSPQQENDDTAGIRRASTGGVASAAVGVFPLQAKKLAAANSASLLPPPKLKFFPSGMVVESGGTAAVPPPIAAAVPEAVQQPPSAELQAANQKLASLRAELAEANGRNLDLELDHANVSARVLELESEASLLKASLAEWRRKHASLEQQLDVQARDFTRRLGEEKALLMESLQLEVAGQLATLKLKWGEREQELLRAAAGQLV